MGELAGSADGSFERNTQEVPMSLSANIDHLAIAAGIEAVVVDTGTREYRGDEQWHRVLDGAIDLFRRTEERSIRLVVGKHTIVVQKEGDETVAVVLPTGHAIAKSLRRMIRRMARKDRGPLPKEFMKGGPLDQQSGVQTGAVATQPQPGRAHAQPGMSPGVTTPSPSPMSAPTPTTSGQPAQPKTGEDKTAQDRSASEREASERGGLQNF